MTTEDDEGEERRRRRRRRRIRRRRRRKEKEKEKEAGCRANNKRTHQDVGKIRSNGSRENSIFQRKLAICSHNG